MGAEKLHTYITMMGGPLRMGVCVAIWVIVVVRAAAQDDANLRTPVNTAVPFRTLDGLRRFINGPTSTSIDTRMRMLPRTTLKGLERIGGRVEENSNGGRWFVNGHSYNVDDSTGTRAWINPANGQPGGAHRLWEGEGTREGPHHLFTNSEVSEGVEQVSGTSSDQAGNENTDTYLNGPAENKSSLAPDVESANWSRESSQWTYQEGEWVVVPLPDPAYPSLPPPPPPTAALVVVTNNKVEVERNVSDLVNVTLHYRFYLSENQDPETKPQLKVYHVVGGTRNLLQEDTEQGDWYSRTLDVPQADISSIVFEGWLKTDADVIALSNVDTTGVMLNKDESLDVGDELTLTAAHPDMTMNFTPTPTTEGNRTQDSQASEEVSQPTDTHDQDNSTATPVPPADTQVDLSSNSTANTSQGRVEDEVSADNVTDTSINSSELETLTDNLDNKTLTLELMNGTTDMVALNSSMTGGDNVTTDDGKSDYFNSTTTTDEEESEADDTASTTTPVTDDETTMSEVSLDTDENTNNSSTLSISGVTTDALEANTSVTLPVPTTINGTFVNTDTSLSLDTPSKPPTRTGITEEGGAVSKNVGGDELTSGTSLVSPQFNGTLRNVTSPPGVTVSIQGTASESTPLPSLSSNSTEAVMAVPVSNTSWQVFQVFLVLCVMGLLALGFLYWKKKRRQDDEIPVFTRHTDYHNPTFSMEDAANFMSRTGRNTYKTIE